MSTSYGNKLIVESFKNRAGPQTVVKSGFGQVKQRNSLAALRILVDAKINDTLTIPRGSYVHVKEKDVSIAPWGTQVYESDAIGEPFIIITLNEVEFVTDKNGMPLVAVA